MLRIFYIVACSLFFMLTAFTQHAPFIDYNRFFKTFYNNSFRQLEFQPIQSFEGSDVYTVYVDYRGDFKLYDGQNVQLITNQIINYKLSDGQLAWKVGSALYNYDKNTKNLLTVFGDRFVVSDSLVVYEDTRFNSINYRYLGQTNALFQSTGDLRFPTQIGDNILVYRENGDFIKFLWRGKTFDYNVYSRDINFECGMDIIAFNDPLNQTFTIFDKGEFVDVEMQFAKRYEAGRGFVVYEDQQGNLWMYKNHEKTMLSTYSANFWDVKDDLVVWEENSMIYTFYNNEKVKVVNYKPADYKLKNSTYVFRNSMGGISAFSKGKVVEITKQTQSSYEIYGNTILVELFNKSFLVYSDGGIFEN
jgi:hypothetical protein